MESMSREMKISIEASSIFPGFRFSPTDVELISYYLKRKLEGDEKSVEVIPEVEIYKFEPWDLPGQSIINSEGEWFFFCTRGRKYPHGSQNRRATELGYWKATGKERNVKLGLDVIGTKRTLVFHVGRAPKGERTEWIMHEYRMNGMSQDALVVCRLRRNPEFRAGSSQRQSSNLQEGLCSEAVTDQTCISEWDKTAESYSPTESEHKPSSDIAESSNCHQDSDEDDFYAEILKDDIIKLDEASVPTLPLLIPVYKLLSVANQTVELRTTQQELVCVGTLGRTRDEEHTIKEPAAHTERQPELSSCFLGLFQIKTVNRRAWNTIFLTAAALLACFVILLGIPWPTKDLGFGT